MMRNCLQHIAISLALFALIAAPAASEAGLRSLVLAYDRGGIASLSATGEFDTLDKINPSTEPLPALDTLLSYDSVLAFTNTTPSNPEEFGNLLADYVDAGGHLALATYAYSSPWAATGRIATPGYAPLTNEGENRSPSGEFVPTEPNDVLFAGVDIATLNYFRNSNFAVPGLDPSATLLATDGFGVNMAARNAAGNIVGLNVFPSDNAANSPALYQLVANAMKPIPEPATIALVAALCLGAAARRHRCESL